jgi:hypothetical protein
VSQLMSDHGRPTRQPLQVAENGDLLEYYVAHRAAGGQSMAFIPGTCHLALVDA